MNVITRVSFRYYGLYRMLWHIRFHSDTSIQNALKETKEESPCIGPTAPMFKNFGIASGNDSAGMCT